MYKLKIQLIEMNGCEEIIMHEAHSPHVRSIQEAFQSYDGKELFEVYLAIQEHITKRLKEYN